jgi:hypothetical protein
VQKGKDLSAQDKKRIEAQAKAKASYDTELAKLLDPSQDFAAWRTLVATFSNCVPTIQFTDPASQRDVLVRQGLALAEAGSVAIRVTSESGAQVYSAIQALLKEMKLRDRLLIIFDCGQGRSRLDERAEFARNGIKLIVDKSDLKQEELRAVCMSSSFPLVGHNGLKPIENLDWDLWDGASESFSFLVSDYAATRRIHNPTTYVPADWRATVVFPYGNEWLIYRGLNANDPAGWVDGSRAILEQVGSMPAGVWGGDVLSAAAKGDIANANATRFWYAAKVNLHIHHQITEVPGALSGDDA